MKKPKNKIEDYRDRMSSPMGCKLIKPANGSKKTTTKKKGK